MYILNFVHNHLVCSIVVWLWMCGCSWCQSALGVM